METRYTYRTAGMTLATARDIIEYRPNAGWSPDQRARAIAVIQHWLRIRKTQRSAKSGV